jgi:hypothetical protein
MHKGRLIAGGVCFPMRWSLMRNLGQDIPHLHAPVPGFQVAPFLQSASDDTGGDLFLSCSCYACPMYHTWVCSMSLFVFKARCAHSIGNTNLA